MSLFQRLVDQVVGVIAADNMGLSCSLVEQSVIQGALQEIEVAMQKAITLRRQFKPGSGQVFVDTEYMGNQKWLSVMPQSLRPRAALTSDQLQVYKDFLSFGPLQKMQHSSAASAANQTNLAPPATTPSEAAQPTVMEVGGGANIQQQQSTTGIVSQVPSEANLLSSTAGDNEAVSFFLVGDCP